MKVKQVCPMCGQEYEMEVVGEAEDNLCMWMSGKLLLQEALPDLNPMEREFLKTGSCPDCQAVLFGTDYVSTSIQPVLE